MRSCFIAEYKRIQGKFNILEIIPNSYKIQVFIIVYGIKPVKLPIQILVLKTCQLAPGPNFNWLATAPD